MGIDFFEIPLLLMYRSQLCISTSSCLFDVERQSQDYHYEEGPYGQNIHLIQIIKLKSCVLKQLNRCVVLVVA